jgi:hypothetical protein
LNHEQPLSHQFLRAVHRTTPVIRSAFVSNYNAHYLAQKPDIKKLLPPVIIALSILITGCGPVSPENYFNTAVLSSNMLHGFANETDWREFESPSVTMVGNSGETAPMKRMDIVKSKIEHAEENLSKLKDLKETNETREMVVVAKEMYEHALPVYKNEYAALARLYDDNGSKEQIQSSLKSIEQKYAGKHAVLHYKLISFGKEYAKKNNINVMWDIQTSPQ